MTKIVDFINTKKLSKTAQLLTQQYRVGAREHIPAAGPAAARSFPDTLAASFAGSRLVVLGEGQMNAEDHSAILTQFAFDSDKSVAEVGSRYVELIGMFGRDRLGFRSVVATIMGSADRTVGTKNVAPVTPIFIHTTLKETLAKVNETTEEIYLHLLTDYVCHLLRPFGWILPDAGYVHRLHRVRIFPHFEDIVNILAQKELSRVLAMLQKTDLSMVKKAIDAKMGLSPAMISSHMSSSLLRAYELSRNTYDATSVAASVLTLIARVAAPDTPKDLLPTERVVKSEAFAYLIGNFALVLAAQDMIKNHPQVVGRHYDDEEMASQILPLFREALMTNGVYKIRITADVVDFMGKRSALDRYHSPRKVAIYESYDASPRVESFTPVRHLRDERSRFLKDIPEIGAALTALMKPIAELFSTRDIVEDRMVAFDTASTELTDSNAGVDIYVAFPSLTEREVAQDLPAGSLSAYLVNGEAPDVFEIGAEGKPDPTKPRDPARVKRVLDGMAYDHYAMLMHLAVMRAADQSVMIVSSRAGAGDSATNNNIALVWDIRTQHVHPLGSSAILAGAVSTSEPLEAIVYQQDYEATKRLTTEPIQIQNYEDHIHIWDWYSASTKLASSGTFVTRIGGKTFNISIQEFEMLGMGATRKMAYFLTPHATAAVARMWCDWMDQEGRFVAGRINAKGGDDITRSAFKGLAARGGIQLVTMLAAIGNSATGGRIAELVRQQLADALYDANMMDEIPRLSVGLFHTRLRVWAGLQTLALLGLLSAEMVRVIYDRIKSTDAMTAFVSIDRATRRERVRN